MGVSGDLNKQNLYTIDVTHGTVKNKVLNPDNTGEYQVIHYVPEITGVKSFTRRDPIEVYPNPVSGNLPLTLSANVKSVEILSISGHPVRNYEIENPGERCTLNLYGISNGIYLVRMTDKSGLVHITKLVINN